MYNLFYDAPVTAFLPDESTDAEIEAEKALFGPLTQAVRELADAALRTATDAETIRVAQREIEDITARLRKEQMAGSYGVRYRADGRSRAWGNAVVGLRNPIAPPLRPRVEDDRVVCDFHLGPLYEGPPGLVHGGIISLVLDQLLGHAAGRGGTPRMTGTLTVRYRRGTPLGDLRAEAWVDRVDGAKAWAKAHMIGPDGLTAEGEGVFIRPRWAGLD